MTESYSLVGTIASITVDWMGEDTSRQDCYDQTIAYALATFVDGTAITPRGYDETRQFDIYDTRSVLSDGGLSEFGVDCPEPEEPPSDLHVEQTATDASDDYKFTRPQCRALTDSDDRCSNPVERGGSDEFCPRHVDTDCRTIDDQLETDGGQSMNGTERIKVECRLCQGAGCFLSGHLCEACGGYGTVYISTYTATEASQ